MKAKVTKRDRRKLRVKDLTSKDAANVKGGATSNTLLEACSTGAHIKKAVITV